MGWRRTEAEWEIWMCCSDEEDFVDFTMSGEEARKNRLVEPLNWKLLEDVLGDVRKQLEEDFRNRYETS